MVSGERRLLRYIQGIAIHEKRHELAHQTLLVPSKDNNNNNDFDFYDLLKSMISSDFLMLSVGLCEKNVDGNFNEWKLEFNISHRSILVIMMLGLSLICR